MVGEVVMIWGHFWRWCFCGIYQGASPGSVVGSTLKGSFPQCRRGLPPGGADLKEGEVTLLCGPFTSPAQRRRISCLFQKDVIFKESKSFGKILNSLCNFVVS